MVAKECVTFTKAQRLTSQIGVALWELPCPPCGLIVPHENLEKVRHWAMESYEIYSALAAEPEIVSQFGVKLRDAVSFFPMPIKNYKSEYERLHGIKKSGLKGFRHDPSVLQNTIIREKEPWMPSSSLLLLSIQTRL